MAREAIIVGKAKELEGELDKRIVVCGKDIYALRDCGRSSVADNGRDRFQELLLGLSRPAIFEREHYRTKVFSSEQI